MLRSNVLGTPCAERARVRRSVLRLRPRMFQRLSVQAPTWDGGSRINIVFFGLRGGLILAARIARIARIRSFCLRVDPVSKTAGMISIPRDLWVNIPGFGYSRINTAWTDGEASKLPGGGPGLAMQTVSQLMGVPIQYYAQVDFDTFVAFINTIGGVDIRTL